MRLERRGLMALGEEDVETKVFVTVVIVAMETSGREYGGNEIDMKWFVIDASGETNRLWDL